MTNAWSLAASILNGTFDKDYPIMKKKEVEHSDYYYDYKRNDPNRKNPFTDPADRARAETVVGNIDKDFEFIKNSGGYEWTPGSPWPPSEFDIQMNDPDDVYHDFEKNLNNNIKNTEKKQMTRNHQFKYHEEEILKDIEEYISLTYQGHYTGTKHEFRKVQTIDLMAARDIAAQFCQANILKYGSRYGSKDGRNKKDLLKVIHYAMLLLHFDGHYGEPSMPSGNFDQMP